MLTVVGDADQSIYAFRGANIRNILDFEQDFPNASTILLEQNYRSTQTILNAANAVIGHNKGRKAKQLWSDSGTGERIVGYVADDEHDEARFVSAEIDTLTDKSGVKPADVAVFYRTNAQSRVFEEVFIRTGQPYKVVGGVRFYERREVRDAVAYLRMLINPADEISLRRILNTPKRGIGDRAGRLRERARRAGADHLLGRVAACRGRARSGLPLAQRDHRLRRDGRGAPVDGRGGGAARRGARVGARPGRAYLTELEASDDPQDETRLENLAELVAVAREFSDDPETDPTLPDFLERVALVADTDQIPDAPDGDDSGVVTLMTLHTAKGLEFPVVFLTGLEDGVFPALPLAR